eukprot:5310737-Amphidinium_carterae.1
MSRRSGRGTTHIVLAHVLSLLVQEEEDGKNTAGAAPQTMWHKEAMGLCKSKVQPGKWASAACSEALVMSQIFGAVASPNTSALGEGASYSRRATVVICCKTSANAMKCLRL